jgi:GNAT superfamily N-acetyltransferase
MLATAAQLLHDIRQARPRLLGLAEAEASERPAPSKWSPKEIVGHLVDSAANNHQRFVRAQQGLTELAPYRYAQEFWVKTQDYQAADWPQLVALWHAYNSHLAHVVTRIQPEFLDTPLLGWGDGEPVTLRFVATDYVRHLQHHLKQIFPKKPLDAAEVSPYLVPLGADDLRLVQYIGRATYEPHYPHLWHPGGLDWYMEYSFGSAALSRDFADPNIAYFLAADEGQVIGFVKLRLHSPLPDGSMRNALYLEKIYLLPQSVGTGAGQRLIEGIVLLAAARGREAVWLNVMKTGPIRAYERAGFRIVGETSFDLDLLKAELRGAWTMVRPAVT